MQKKLTNFFIIFCLCSIILIPVGIALMCLSSNWKKKTKIIIASVSFIIYVALTAFLLLFQPDFNNRGFTLPFNNKISNIELNSDFYSWQDENENSVKDSKKKKRTNKIQKETAQKNLPNKIVRQKGKFEFNRFILSLFFILLMLLLIINQNRKSKKSGKYENPYVDTNQYKLPLPDDAKIPMVHYLRIHTYENEKILFATETSQAGNEGDLVISNKRIVILNKTEKIDLALKDLEAVASTTNTVIQISSGSKKYYIFLPESQVKYALAVIRWAYKKYC